MTRGLAWFVLMVALVAILIPFPGLLPLSLVGFALIWLATPSWGRR